MTTSSKRTRSSRRSSGLSRACDLVSSGLFASLLIAAVIASSVCSRRRPPLPPETRISTAEADPILQELERRESSVVRYRAVLRVRGKGPDGRFSATQVLAFERPGQMRVELLGAFGSTRWVTVASGGEILVYIPSRHQFLKETDVPRVVGALLGVTLGTRDIMAVLTGNGFPIKQQRDCRAFRRGESIRIELEEGSFEIEGGQVRFATTPSYSVSYPTRWKDMGRQVPDRINLETSDLKASLEIEDLDVNIPLAPEVFRVVLPDDAERLELHQIEGEAVFVKTERP